MQVKLLGGEGSKVGKKLGQAGICENKFQCFLNDNCKLTDYCNIKIVEEC